MAASSAGVIPVPVLRNTHSWIGAERERCPLVPALHNNLERYLEFGGLLACAHGSGSMRRARQSTRGTRRSMPKPTLLYAWAVPVPALPFLDHTWVTSYDNRLTPYPDDQQVAAAGALYWVLLGRLSSLGRNPKPSHRVLRPAVGRSRACPVSCASKRGLSHYARGTRYHFYLRCRWGMPPIGQSSTLFYRRRKRSATYRPQCPRVHRKPFYLRSLWPSARGMVASDR